MFKHLFKLSIVCRNAPFCKISCSKNRPEWNMLVLLSLGLFPFTFRLSGNVLELCGRALTRSLYNREVQIRSRRSRCQSCGWSWCSSVFKTNSGILFWIMSRPFCSASFPTCCSLMHSSDATLSELLKSLSKHWTF